MTASYYAWVTPGHSNRNAIAIDFLLVYVCARRRIAGLILESAPVLRLCSGPLYDRYMRPESVQLHSSYTHADACSGAGTTPSCCISPNMSIWTQFSTNRPFSVRQRSIYATLTGLLVGGMPMNYP